MKRSTAVNTTITSVVIAVIVGSHVVTPNIRFFSMASSGLTLLVIAILLWRGCRGGWVSRFCIVLCCLASGIGFGIWFQSHCPGKPIAGLGQSTQITAAVGTVTDKNGFSSVQLHVVREGDSGQLVSYTAYWSTGIRQAVGLTSGQRVILNGIFVAHQSTQNPIQSWLAPTYSFRGNLIGDVSSQKTWKPLSGLENAVEATVPKSSTQNAQLALSMVIGHQASIAASLQTLFLQSGVTHLLAASGANVVLFCRFVEIMWIITFRSFGLRLRWLDHVVLFVGIWGFVGACGFAVPIVRAGILSSYTLVGRFFRRKTNAFTALVMSCLAFVIVEPYAFTSVSGLFSVTATFAMAQAMNMDRVAVQRGERSDSRSIAAQCLRRLQRLGSHFLELLFISLMIDVYMIPFVWWWFGQLTPYGALATVAVEPFVVILLPLTIFWSVLSECAVSIPFQFFAWQAHLVGTVVVALVNFLLSVLTWFARRPYSLSKMPVLPTWMLGTYFVLLLTVQHFRLIRNRFLRMLRHRFV